MFICCCQVQFQTSQSQMSGKSMISLRSIHSHFFWLWPQVLRQTCRRQQTVTRQWFVVMATVIMVTWLKWTMVFVGADCEKQSSGLWCDVILIDQPLRPSASVDLTIQNNQFMQHTTVTATEHQNLHNECTNKCLCHLMWIEQTCTQTPSNWSNIFLLIFLQSVEISIKKLRHMTWTQSCFNWISVKCWFFICDVTAGKQSRKTHF